MISGIVGIVGIEKQEDAYVLIGEKKDVVLKNARPFIDPVWSLISEEARTIVQNCANKKINCFNADEVENNNERGVVVYFSGIYEDGWFTQGVVPIEKYEDVFLNLINDLKNVM